jgi:chromosome segregation ATPase
MNRLLLFACLTFALPSMVLAQNTANPSAKVESKDNKASRGAASKPKSKLMTREELRACLVLSDANKAETVAIKDAQAINAKERADLLATKEELTKQGPALSDEATALKAEQAELLKTNEELKAQVPKLPRAEAEAKIADYKAKVAEHDAKIDAFNGRKNKYDSAVKEFDAKVEGINAATRELDARIQNHMDKVEDWKQGCANKLYNEDDETAIRKEMGLKKN